MPQDPNDSSQGFPFFDQIAKAMASSGPVQWDMARQFAMMTATNSDPESNVEPTARIAVNQLASVADLHVRDVTGLSTSESTAAPKIDVVTRSIWAHHTLDAFKFYFSELLISTTPILSKLSSLFILHSIDIKTKLPNPPSPGRSAVVLGCVKFWVLF